MFIHLPTILLLISATAITILQVMRPAFRYAWLIASAGAFLAWFTVLILSPSFATSFRADEISWPYALSLTTLSLAVIITSVVRENFPNLFSWAGTLGIGGLGLLAIFADSPIALALIWGALDLIELGMQLRPAGGSLSSERVVAGFAARLLGIMLLLWAALIGDATGDFHNANAQAGLLFILAAGLRVGVLPLQLSSTLETSMRRGFGTNLRLVATAASLVLLARVPAESAALPWASPLLLLSSAAGLYAGWMWLRAPDELSGRPFWIISVAALAVSAALRGNPLGSIAWGCALVLAGGALFLNSVYNKTLARTLIIIGGWGISALPFSLNAIVWQGYPPINIFTWIALPVQLVTPALLTLGLIRLAARPARPSALEAQPIWARNLYPIGIGFLLANLLLLGFVGWGGARSVGSLPTALVVGASTFALYWLTPRLRWLNPTSARGVLSQAGNLRLDAFQQFFGGIFRGTARFVDALSAALEGEGGILWTLLFLVLFLSLLTPRIP